MHDLVQNFSPGRLEASTARPYAREPLARSARPLCLHPNLSRECVHLHVSLVKEFAWYDPHVHIVKHKTKIKK